VIKTAQAIMNAFATLPTPVAAVSAPIIAATGAAQIATIAATTFEGGGSVPSAGGGAGGAGGGGATPAPMTKPASTERGPAFRGGAAYRHRDLDIVAADGGYPGSAFDLAPARRGQRRYRD